MKDEEETNAEGANTEDANQEAFLFYLWTSLGRLIFWP